MFGGGDEGYFFALDAETATRCGGRTWEGSSVTYLSQGRQFVSVAAGNALFTFALQLDF